MAESLCKISNISVKLLLTIFRRIIPGHDTIVHVGAGQPAHAETSSSGSTPFSSFESSSATGAPSDASSKSSLQHLNDHVDDYNWDLPRHRPDWEAIMRKRSSSSSSSLISAKRVNTGSPSDNLSASSSKSKSKEARISYT